MGGFRTPSGDNSPPERRIWLRHSIELTYGDPREVGEGSFMPLTDCGGSKMKCWLVSRDEPVDEELPDKDCWECGRWGRHWEEEGLFSSSWSRGFVVLKEKFDMIEKTREDFVVVRRKIPSDIDMIFPLKIDGDLPILTWLFPRKEIAGFSLTAFSRHLQRNSVGFSPTTMPRHRTRNLRQC